MTANHRSGFVVFVGRPNVGKSTLLNALAGQKLAIVSPKPQTTRTRITAILTREDAQVVLVDTPGVTKSADALRRSMQRITRTAVTDSDLALVVVEARDGEAEISDADRAVVEAARKGNGRGVLAINKVDKIKNKKMLLPWMEAYAKETGVDVIVPISAKNHDGLEDLVEELLKRLPEAPPMFPKEMVTEQAERVICAELVREQLLLLTRQEIPHAAAVVIEVFEDQRTDQEGGDGGLCRLEGRIYIERESQKGIVVGKGGRTIKEVSTAARAQIEEFLGCKVYLRLTVHVDKDWRQSDRAIERFGYGLPEA